MERVTLQAELPNAAAGTSGFEYFFVTTTRISPSLWSLILAEDIDNDGDVDLVGEEHVFFNNGAAQFRRSLLPRRSDSGAFDLGDLDGDGDLDIYRTSSYSPHYFNDGNGLFTSGPKNFSHSYISAVDLGDIDGDGDLDAMESGFQGTYVWLNDGTGGFSRLPKISDAYGQSVTLVDIDGDDILDAVVGNRTTPWWPSTTDIWIGDGAGGFTLAPAVAAEGDRLAAVADLDGDGDADLIVAVSYGMYHFETEHRLLLNDSNGVFADGGQILFQTNAGPVTLLDIDGDTDLDAIVTQDGSPAKPLQIWLNDGTGQFTDTGERHDVESSESGPFADFDGDGDLDVFMGDTSSGVLLGLNEPGYTPTPRMPNTALVHLVGDAEQPWSPTARFIDADWRGGEMVLKIQKYAHTDDRIRVADNIAGNINVNGTELRDGLQVIGHLSTAGGVVSGDAELVITFDPSSTEEQVQNVLRSVVYVPSDDGPVPGLRICSVQVTDHTGRSDADVRKLAVMVDPALPIAQDDDFATTETGQLPNSDLFRDNGNGPDYDLGGNYLITAVNGDPSLVAKDIYQPEGGRIHVNGHGTFGFLPLGDYEHLPKGFSETTTFTYTLNGGDTSTVTIRVIGEDNNDVFQGTDARDVFDSGLYDDILYGRGGDDRLSGGRGDDRLFGGPGDDLLKGGDGADLIRGGDGFDFAFSYESGGTYDLSAQIQTDGDRLNSIEGLIGSSQSDTLIGDEGDNILIGAGGQDKLIGGGGDDKLDARKSTSTNLDGGAGNDIFLPGVGFTSLRSGPGMDMLIGTPDQLHLTSIADPSWQDTMWVKDATFGAEDTFFEVLGGQFLRMTVNYESSSGPGSFWVDFSDPLSFLDKALLPLVSGDDTFVWIATLVPVVGAATGTEVHEVFLGSAGADAIDAQGGQDMLYGLGGNDTLNGGTGLDQLLGGDGDDLLFGGEGGDVLNGGAGIDTASYDGVRDRLRADLLDPAINNGGAGGDTFIDVENLIGGRNRDNLRGDNHDNVLLGGFGVDYLMGRAGDDQLFGGAHDDVLIGGAGGDLLNGGAGQDRAQYSDAKAGVTVDLIRTGTNTGDALGDTFTAIEDVAGTRFADALLGNSLANVLLGNAGNDRLTGRGGDDELNGGKGSDVLLGGLGNDILLGGSDSDTFVFDAGLDVIRDYELEKIRFDKDLWGGAVLTRAEIVDFASVVGSDTVFDFGAGNTLTLEGFIDTSALEPFVSLF